MPKYLMAYADTFQPIGIYQASARNLHANDSGRSIIHAEMSSAANPSEPYFVQREGQWFCISRLENIVARSKLFGQGLIDKFAAENIAMGITQSGLTGHVRRTMIDVVSALFTGSLYDAIAEARAIPDNAKDSTFITNARLLEFINAIEDFLGAPRSEGL